MAFGACTPDISFGSDIESQYEAGDGVICVMRVFNSLLFFALNFYINLFSIFIVGGSGGQDSPHYRLQSLRLGNVDRVVIGHLNINSIRNKFGLLSDMVCGRIDILLRDG